MSRLNTIALAFGVVAFSGIVACGADDFAPSADVPAAGASNEAAAAGSSGTSASGVGGSRSGSSGSSGGAAGQSGTGAAGEPAGFAGSSGSSSDVGGGSGSGESGGANAAAAGGIAGSSGSSGLSGSGGSGGSGGSLYRPCPTSGDPCKILPFGDSITRGVKSSDEAGYRSQLFKLIVAAKQKATFTGSLTNGPTQVSGQTFPNMHEGHAGWTIDPGYNTSGNYGGISSLVPSPALNGNPHIVLLHIGTNDLFAKDTANMSTRLEALVDKIALSAPQALIVLAQITPTSTSDAALTTYNSKIPGIVQSHAEKGQHIIGVDMSHLPVPADLYDGSVHPNDQGYAYMAGVWYAAIKELLPK